MKGFLLRVPLPMRLFDRLKQFHIGIYSFQNEMANTPFRKVDKP